MLQIITCRWERPHTLELLWVTTGCPWKAFWCVVLELKFYYVTNPWNIVLTVSVFFCCLVLLLFEWVDFNKVARYLPFKLEPKLVGVPCHYYKNLPQLGSWKKKKKQAFILWQFWKPESGVSVIELKWRWNEMKLPFRASGKNAFPASFWYPSGFSVLWLTFSVCLLLPVTIFSSYR